MQYIKDYDTKKKELIEKINYYKSIIDNDDGEDKKYTYLVNVLYKLMSMSLDVDQIYEPTKITECKRVIKIKRGVPVDELRKSHPEILVFEGVYLLVDCVIIPHDVLRSVGFYRRNLKNMDKLPEGYCYSTLKDVGPFGMALKESSVTRYMNYSLGWEYFDLNINM